MRAWVEKDEYATHTKREAAIDWKRYDADRVYREQVNEQQRQHRGEQVIYIKLKDFERPKANPAPSPS